MPEFEVVWAPLSGKWQVWQQQLDQYGCMVETLIGEYSSEGRATHEAAIQRGEIAPESIYQAPPRRRWYSLSGFVPIGMSKSRENPPDPVENQVKFKEREVVDSPVANIPGTPETEPETVVRNGGATQESDSFADRDVRLRTELVSKLEAPERRAEFSEVDHLRQLLKEALRYLESGDMQAAA